MTAGTATHASNYIPSRGASTRHLDKQPPRSHRKPHRSGSAIVIAGIRQGSRRNARNFRQGSDEPVPKTQLPRYHPRREPTNAYINIIYTNTLLHLPRPWDNLDPMIASKGQASVTRALPSSVTSVFSSGQVPKLRPIIIIEVVVPSPA